MRIIPRDIGRHFHYLGSATEPSRSANAVRVRVMKNSVLLAERGERREEVLVTV
jgi:hypothetical protein